MTTRISIRTYGESTPPPVTAIDADHGLVDDRGRRVGGQANIEKYGAGWSLRVVATRDRVEFGARRRATFHDDHEDAVTAGMRKLEEQGEYYRRIFEKPGSGWRIAS